MTAVRENLEKEFATLARKIASLRNFIDSKTFPAVRPVQREQMPVQLDAMLSYQKCLRLRIEDLQSQEDAERAEIAAAMELEAHESEELEGDSRIVFPNEAPLSTCGLEEVLCDRMVSAGFLTVGDLREAYVSALEDGYDLDHLPGIDNGKDISFITEMLLNDRDYVNPEIEVFPDEKPLADCGIDQILVKTLQAAGFMSVGEVREAYVSVLRDGGNLWAVPGVDRRGAIYILKEFVLNDRDYGDDSSDVIAKLLEPVTAVDPNDPSKGNRPMTAEELEAWNQGKFTAQPVPDLAGAEQTSD